MARFFASPVEDQEQVLNELLAKDFNQLDDCFDSEPDFIFIDKEKRSFYLCDKESLGYANEIIAEKFQESCKTVTLLEVKKWR